MDLFDGFLKRVMEMGPKSPQTQSSQNELICIELQKNGWTPAEPEYVPGSSDVITHWTKGDQTQSVRLSPAEQARWIKLQEKV